MLAGPDLIASTITFHIKRTENLSMGGRAGMAALKYATSRVQIQIPMQFRLQVPPTEEEQRRRGALGPSASGLWPAKSLTTEVQWQWGTGHGFRAFSRSSVGRFCCLIYQTRRTVAPYTGLCISPIWAGEPFGA